MKLVLHFIKKEFLQFKRDPKMFGIILVSPIVQLILLGFAVNMEVEVVHTALFDQSKSAESREFVGKFKASSYFSFDYYCTSEKEIQERIDNGEAILGIVITQNFSEQISRGNAAPVQIVVDGSDGNAASITMGYVQTIVKNYSIQILAETLKRKGKKNYVQPLTAETRVWFNPELKTRNYMVPAIVGLLLTLITIILTSLAIVKEKEIGTLEQLIVTPIKPYQMILGKLIPFLLLGFVSVGLILTAMYLFFGIAVKGSLIFLLLSAFAFVLSTLGLGLFVSTITKTQQQAMMIAIFVVMMPMIYLSGFAFPIENMPEVIQYITYLIPLRYFITIIRGVILKGLGFAHLWQQLVILFAFGVIILYLSSLRFSKKTE